MKLYELTGEYAQLLQLAEDGEDVAASLAALDDAVEAKGAGLARVRAGLLAEANALRVEEKRLAERRKAIEANAERVDDYVRGCMLRAGITSIKGGSFSISLREGPGRVEVDDVDALPVEYVRVKTERSADKVAILRAYKELGECVEGARVVPNTVLVVR